MDQIECEFNISNMCRRRLSGEIRLLKKEPLEYIDVGLNETNILVWYFMVKGPEFSEYAGGMYVGKIIYTPEYPFAPPDFVMLTPNGRFSPDRKICLSNSGFHAKEWSSAWNINSTLTGFLSIFLDDHEDGISHIHESKETRQILAQKSIEFNKQHYGDIIKLFTRFIDSEGNPVVPTVTVAPIVQTIQDIQVGNQEVGTIEPEPVPVPVKKVVQKRKPRIVADKSLAIAVPKAYRQMRPAKKRETPVIDLGDIKAIRAYSTKLKAMINRTNKKYEYVMAVHRGISI